MESSPAPSDVSLPSIVCLSPQEWHVDLPTNRQQIMAHLHRLGCRVTFVETGPWAGRYARTLISGPGRRSVLRQLVVGEEVAAGLRVVKAPTLLPWGHKYRIAARLNARVTAWVLRRHTRSHGSRVVLWLYDPCFADCIGRVGERFAVYDCVDDYPEQTGGDKRKHQLVATYDALAASRSRLVFATARPLAERHLRHNPRTHLVRNVGEFSHFARAADQPLTPVELASVARPIIGFAGNLMASKVDFDLLDELAVSRPEWTILLIGPTRADATGHLRRLSQRANVRYISARPYAELPTYVAAFDVALIPYLANAYTRSCFPLKTYEYLAAGKPVVASGLPELAELAPHVELVDDHDGFVDAVERALTRTTEEEIEARRKIAAANTWETRTARLLQLITAELADGRLPVRDVATTLSR